jgi:hypothetical protein
MRVPLLPSEPVYLRFIGSFVTGVGLCYLLALLCPSRLATVLWATAVVRVSVGTFVGLAIATGALTWHWSSVCVTDLGLAAFQLVLLYRAGLDHE